VTGGDGGLQCVRSESAAELLGSLIRTDADGRAAFRFDRPGRWLIAGTWLRKTDKPDTEWESDFTTLTLQVAAH